MAIGRIPEPGTGIPESIVDAKGDIVTATAADTPARLAVGTNEHRLVAASGEATGLKYVADTTNYAIAAKGDLLVGSAADTLSALSVGTNGHTLVADSSQSLGVKWAAPAAGGKVLQVVQGTHSTQVTTSSSTFADTGLTASITPSATNSKVLVMVSHQNVFTTGAAGVYGQFRLYRGATNIQDFAYLIGRSTSGIDLHDYAGTIYLDSPNTTSSTTYKTQWASFNNNSQVILNNGSVGQATITLMEIGA